MKEFKAFIVKYRAELLIALAAIISICNTLASEGQGGIVTSIIIAIVAVLVEVLKHGISEEAITLLSKAILIISDEVKKSDKKDEMVAMAIAFDELTVEDIKARLLEK
jgi:hypothetical protein